MSNETYEKPAVNVVNIPKGWIVVNDLDDYIETMIVNVNHIQSVGIQEIGAENLVFIRINDKEFYPSESLTDILQMISDNQ